MDDIARQTSAALPGTIVAKEGMVLELIAGEKTEDAACGQLSDKESPVAAAV